MIPIVEIGSDGTMVGWLGQAWLQATVGFVGWPSIKAWGEKLKTKIKLNTL